MLNSQENKNKLGITNSKKQGMKFPQKIVKKKDLGDISLDLSKEEKIMRNSPGLMENSMIENITAMNSIFAQKQSERLGLNDFNNINNSQNNINNSNQTFNELVSSGISGTNSMNSENPLDRAVIIKDSEEVKQEEEKRKKKKEKEKKKKNENGKKKISQKKKKKSYFNKMTILIAVLLIIIILLIFGLIKTYLSVVRDR